MAGIMKLQRAHVGYSWVGEQLYYYIYCIMKIISLKQLQ